MRSQIVHGIAETIVANPSEHSPYFHQSTPPLADYSSKYKTMSTDDLLVNYHDAVIYPSDLALLDSPTDWLNDACINFQMRRLQHTQEESWDAGKEGSRDSKRQKKGIEGIEQFEDLFLDP